LTPEERSKKLREFVSRFPKVQKPEKGYYPVEDAKKYNPKLTREKAIVMA
jgi:hypothetical protein